MTIIWDFFNRGWYEDPTLMATGSGGSTHEDRGKIDESDPGIDKRYQPEWLSPISPETRKLPR